MDIYSAELHLQKLLDYVKDLESDTPKMYKKSKDRLRDISLNCVQIVKILSSILQDESMKVDDLEFQGSEQSDMYRVIESLDSELHSMKSFVGYPEISEKSRVADEFNSDINKRTFRIYKDAFNSVAHATTSCAPAHSCATLIWDWFRIRFITTIKDHPNFKYSISRIRKWLVGIVILFGNNYSEGTGDVFITEFEDWLKNLSGTSGDKYAVPYSVYSIYKQPEKIKISLTSVVLWDILGDLGYSELFNDDSTLFPSEDELYNLCAEHYPEVLDRYRDYKFDPTVLVECNLVGGETK